MRGMRPLTGWGGGVPKCRMSILRNANVACLCLSVSLLSHVEFKKRLCHYIVIPHVAHHKALCHMSNLRNANVALSILRVKGHRNQTVGEPSPQVVLKCLILLRPMKSSSTDQRHNTAM